MTDDKTNQEDDQDQEGNQKEKFPKQTIDPRCDGIFQNRMCQEKGET